VSNRLIVVSNRLPVTIAQTRNGQACVRPSGGGLVTALLPVLRQDGGAWIGWTGGEADPTVERVLHECSGPNYSLHPVFLTADEEASFYRGCCNEIIWPLFHDLPSRCDFDAAFWESYCAVNEKYADRIEQAWQRGDFVWVNDYHLMMVGECLRARDLRRHTGYFHHIPFPHPDILEKMPWRQELLRALLQFNVLGFQTVRDRRNFVACVRHCLPDVHVRHAGGKLLVRSGDRCAAAGVYPISIDHEEFASAAAAPETAEAAAKIRRDLGGTRVVLGIDRLDYTKGILQRLDAFATLLSLHPNLRGRVSFLQVVVPSREEIGEYQQLKLDIERRVSQINGEYATPGWVPVHYLYRSLSRAELVSFYRAAEVALVTPLKDGMNLVAKEFCACRVDERGVLILSEFAGAACELDCGALIVNPYDIQGVVGALWFALLMAEDEQRSRMRAMRAAIAAHDVFQWARSFRGQASLARKAGPAEVLELSYPPAVGVPRVATAS
jgi:trehalose 6-phosphate synthase/phosphatase